MSYIVLRSIFLGHLNVKHSSRLFTSPGEERPDFSAMDCSLVGDFCSNDFVFLR